MFRFPSGVGAKKKTTVAIGANVSTIAPEPHWPVPRAAIREAIPDFYDFSSILRKVCDMVALSVL
jgi:hypothetical protein